jgi:hypothetical protein
MPPDALSHRSVGLPLYKPNVPGGGGAGVGFPLGTSGDVW